uniref:uncharacterized protein LOC122583813 n=1 Tax=Erigeron canadensis TaxID=72917 RepID=UPI001CB93924|nr:uncharacterized protein LOC122583813 [Erigeron canadensis]
MVKKSKVQINLNAANSYKAKNLGSISKTVINGSDHLAPGPVVSVIKPNNESIYVRRSRRLQSIQDPDIEEINVVDSENGKLEAGYGYNGGQRLLVSFRQNNSPRIDNSNNGPSSNQKSVDEKIDDLIKAIEGFKTNGVHANVSCEDNSVNHIYKSLYLESQKKIEALTLENLELARLLEIALGKLEVYENINKSTYTVTISSLENAIEALVSPTSHVGQPSFTGGGANLDGDGCTVANKPTTKKRKNHQPSK